MNLIQKLSMVAACALAAACSRQDSGAEAATPAAAEEAASAEPNTAAVSAEVAERSGIEAAEAAPAAIRTTLTLLGTIQVDPQNVAEVAARYPGVIREVLHQIGDRVQKGAPLARVESNESLQVYTIRAPIAGVITQRHANAGEVAAESSLFEIVNASKVRVDLNVFPQDRGQLRVGQKVRIASTDGGTAGEGTLTFISPLGSAQTQSIVARVSLDNREGRWAPGQFVNADVLLDETEVAVAVKPTALQQVKGRSVVFVQGEQGFVARPVDIGRRSAGAVEITRGVAAGERYATTNTFLLKAELLKSEAGED